MPLIILNQYGIVKTKIRVIGLEEKPIEKSKY